jgi:hypothetical protein
VIEITKNYSGAEREGHPIKGFGFEIDDAFPPGCLRKGKNTCAL